MKNTTAIGNIAETKACEFLAGKGYEILQRNYKDRFCELDIIASTADFICFVEVKYRSRPDFGGAAGAVSAEKQARLQKAAEFWLAQNPVFSKLQPRLDVITVQGSRQPKILHLKNAF